MNATPADLKALRDEIAIRAMQCHLTRGVEAAAANGGKWSEMHATIAKRCYDIADAMLKAREQ